MTTAVTPAVPTAVPSIPLHHPASPRALRPGRRTRTRASSGARAGALVGILALALVAWLGIHPPTAQADATRTLTFDTRLTSVETELETLPGDIVYGWNHLVGPTMWGKRNAEVDFLGSVDYRDGTGPFNGFVTVTRADGTKLALSVSGWSTTPQTEAGTADARFRGTVTVIGGTGAFRGAQGTGTMRGQRKAALGSPVRLVFDVTVQMRG